MAQREIGGGLTVAVAPIAHSPPRDPSVAIEMPPQVKRHIGLDSDRSWIILDEFNVFGWPGFDLAPISGTTDRVDYGFLPPGFFRKLVEKFTELRRQRRIKPTLRD